MGRLQLLRIELSDKGGSGSGGVLDYGNWHQ